MNKSEEANSRISEHDVDIISSLPDHTLEFILSGIPINQVVRTSILSKRWRYLWKAIPSFPSLKFDSVHSKKFVDWALANETPLDLFTLRFSYNNNWTSEMFNECIQTAVMRKVKSLDLTIRPSCSFQLPHCMVKCDSLESLKFGLYNYYRSLILPGCACAKFPALRVLELNFVHFYKHDLSIWFQYPLLEDFSLINCFINNVDPLCISCPRLKTLRIHNLRFSEYCHKVGSCGKLVVSCRKLVVLEYVKCPLANLLFENLHSLKKAVIILPTDAISCPYVSSEMGNNMCKLLAVIFHVESLSLNNYFIQAISAASDPSGNFPASLPNLKTLELTTKFGFFTMNVIIRILKCSPSVESLCLIIQEECLWPRYWNLDEVETRRILTHHLKRVEFLEFNGEKPKLDVARVLLEHGNALEEMVFSWHGKVKYHEKSAETMNIVSKFHKSSSTVKLTALLKGRLDGRDPPRAS